MSKRTIIYVTTISFLMVLLIGTNVTAQSPSEFWEILGNAGTSAGTHFLGTTDREPLEIRVEGRRALRIEPSGRSGANVNIVGGFFANKANPDVRGATISGGGDTGNRKNAVTDNYGAVGGGVGNRAGNSNNQQGDAQYAVVGGGNSNTASGEASTVPGGAHNLAAGQNSFAAGQGAQASHDGSFVWADSSGSPFSSSQDDQFLVRASGGVGIGTASTTSAMLTVAGDVEVSGQIHSTSGGYIFPDGTVRTTANDTLENLTCSKDQLIRWNGSAWECFFDGPTITSYFPSDGSLEYGRDTAIAIGSDDLPIIAFDDQHGGDLEVLHCLDAKCRTGEISVLVDTPSAGIDEPSIAIGGDGLANILYRLHESPQDRLRIAHCNDVACTSASHTDIHVGNFEEFPTITTGTDGFPLISYAVGRDLFVTHCEDFLCQSSMTNHLDGTVDSKRELSIAVGSDGLGIVVYSVAGTGQRTAHCSDVKCSSAQTTNLPIGGIDAGTKDIAIGNDGYPVIALAANSKLNIIHCEDVFCSSATMTDAGPSHMGDRGLPSVAIGTDSLAIVSYGHDNELRIAHCNDLACTHVRREIVDNKGQTGHYTSIAIGTDGLPIVSYYAPWSGILKVAHCSDSETCTPEFGGGSISPPSLSDLSITVVGNGVVASAPAGINCPGDCSESYSDGTDVTVTAIPDAGAVFISWTGDCDVISGNDCDVTVDDDKSATATFGHTLTVSKAGTGDGTVTSDIGSINCGSTCTDDYTDGTVVTLTATPDGSSTFDSWTGDADCSDGIVTMSLDVNCTANFNAAGANFTLTIVITGTNTGTVTATGINCLTPAPGSGDCSESYASGTMVTITATQASGFALMSGDCSGFGTDNPVTPAVDTITMDSDKTCTVNFTAG